MGVMSKYDYHVGLAFRMSISRLFLVQPFIFDVLFYFW